MNLSNNHISFIIVCGLLVISTFACRDDQFKGWNIPGNELARGEGDGDIPAINNPQFTKASEVTFLSDSSKVVGIKLKNKIRAYPIEILDWHEVVNDVIDSLPIAVTYSALSGTSIIFDRNTRNGLLEFRVSGILYNSNTIFSEFETFSEWSQMLRKSVKSDQPELMLEAYPALEMNWTKWKQNFPDSEVMNLNTGYNRPYGTYPYGDYQTDSTKIFFTLPYDEEAIDSLNNIYPLKEKILGVKHGEIVKGYRLQSFAVDGFSFIEDEIDGTPVIIIGSQNFETMIAFSRLQPNGSVLNFSTISAEAQIILTDTNGQQWNIFGKSINDSNDELGSLESNIGYWFSWVTFYPQIEIFN